MHQGSVLSPFLFAVLVNVITEFELFYADDIFLISDKFLKWK